MVGGQKFSVPGLVGLPEFFGFGPCHSSWYFGYYHKADQVLPALYFSYLQAIFSRVPYCPAALMFLYNFVRPYGALQGHGDFIFYEIIDVYNVLAVVLFRLRHPGLYMTAQGLIHKALLCVF